MGFGFGIYVGFPGKCLQVLGSGYLRISDSSAVEVFNACTHSQGGRGRLP